MSFIFTKTPTQEHATDCLNASYNDSFRSDVLIPSTCSFRFCNVGDNFVIGKAKQTDNRKHFSRKQDNTGKNGNPLRKDDRLILPYKGLKGKARLTTDDLIPKIRRCRNQHSMAFQIPSASKYAYKNSLFPQNIRDWNELPDSQISSAELSDNCVSKFNSLVRARDLFSPKSQPLVKNCHFGVSSVNYSDMNINT